jgi:hypothetical protein
MTGDDHMISDKNPNTTIFTGKYRELIIFLEV